MRPSVLVVCGSRALAGTGGETWARRVIAARVGELPTGGVLIHGGCAGCPDVWSADAAVARRDLIVRGFFADGHSEARTSLDAPCVTGQWRDMIRPATSWDHFRERNMHLVKEAKWLQQHRAAPALVICLAARNSKTQGGPRTAQYAREQGLEAHTWAWP